MIVDCAHYRGGARQQESPMSIEGAAACAQAGDGFVWLGIHDPDAQEMAAIQRHFDVHELAVEDAEALHQRAKLEAYGDDQAFVVLRTARYLDATEEVEFGEIHLFVGPGFAISLRHGEASELGPARRRLEDRPELVRLGPLAVVWAVLDKVVDDYEPVVEGLANDIEEVETRVFEAESDQTRRVYLLKREVIDFHRAVHPLLAPLAAVDRGAYPAIGEELAPFFRDINDHVQLVHDEVATHRELLTSALQANLAVLSVQQNRVVRTISAWAAIIAVPTLIASIYGMNFEQMPELAWQYGYLMAIAMMVALGAGLFAFFRRVRWLD